MITAIEKTRSLIRTIWATKKPHLIAGFSGGADSLFLLLALKQLRDAGELELIAAHVNYGWRATAARDEAFCRQWCEKQGITLIVRAARDIQVTKKATGSREADARAARRTFFAELMREHTADAIALGHHQDDQLETFFIRLIRGTSLEGLSCMKEYDAPYVRPLLSSSKPDIVQYLDTQNIAYCFDETNESDAFLRNRIRHTLLPGLQACDTRAHANISRTIERLQSLDAYMQASAQVAYRAIFKSDTGIEGDLSAFQQLAPEIRNRLLVLWLCAANVPFTPTQSFLHEITRFLLSPRGGLHTLAPDIFMWKKSDRFGIKHAAL